MTTLEFKDVGRDKQSWTETVATVTYESLMRSIRKHKALMSRDVEFIDGDAENELRIMVGMFRAVGTVRLSEVR